VIVADRREQRAPRFRTPLVLLLVMLFVIVPGLELACDGSTLHHAESLHWHASPAVLSEGVAAPVIHLIRLDLIADCPRDVGESVVSVFVPPRA
jgi:hypothetical protein